MRFVVTAKSPEGMPIASFGSWIVDAESEEAAVGLVRHIKVYRDWWPTDSGWAVEPLLDGGVGDPMCGPARRGIA
jgi:hypothetical protein